ncbi:MAG: ELM1/GtrOC1 family putative glycosyltransferase [Candidatus Omnitrophica bacterium]|nr:ELM1/GtrOC1 family putative glycosyltransferase [Candidatus Omnitrophota bacterium]
MKNNSLLDYLACILFKVLGAVLRFIPVEASLFLGQLLGNCFYYFDFKHRARSYANIKAAFGSKLSPKAITKITKEFYESFGQSLIEIFLIPKVGQAYMKKYIEIEGLENIYAGLKKGKGVILLAVHAGSWELSNIICANLGFPFYLFVKGQSFPRLNELLNNYRRQKGCSIITKEGGLKQLIDALKNNATVGITLDQGGKGGDLVEFFGRTASMSTGGIKLALKYGSSVVPVYFTRKSGPKIKVLVGKEIELSRAGDLEKDVKDNLRRAVQVFEEYIREYPKEYLWTYKIWKYSNQRSLLILSDGKTGHLRQSEAVANIISERLKNKGIKVGLEITEVKFKNKFLKTALSLSSLLSGKYNCQGCLGCLRKFIDTNAYKTLSSFRPDIVISCGSGLSAINFIISRENLSKSVQIMRPQFLSAKKFDLVILPRHDKPKKKKNIVVTMGAPNLVSPQYLEEEGAKLIRSCNLNPCSDYIGLLIGGDSKKFTLDNDIMRGVISEVKRAADKINADILLTTSRRTSAKVAQLLKQEFDGFKRCKLMLIANEKNIPEAVGGILGLSKVVVSSPESISMVSEAANSAKFVVVFKAGGLSAKHRYFLRNLAGNNHIYLSEVKELSVRIEDIWRANPAVNILKDNSLISEAVGKIL